MFQFRPLSTCKQLEEGPKPESRGGVHVPNKWTPRDGPVSMMTKIYFALHGLFMQALEGKEREGSKRKLECYEIVRKSKQDKSANKGEGSGEKGHKGETCSLGRNDPCLFWLIIRFMIECFNTDHHTLFRGRH